jgi:hypothetical protein
MRRCHDFTELRLGVRYPPVYDSNHNRVLIGYGEAGEACYFDWGRCSNKPVDPEECKRLVMEEINRLHSEANKLGRWLYHATMRKTQNPPRP